MVSPDEDVTALDSGEVTGGVEIMTIVDESSEEAAADEGADDSWVETGAVSVAVTGQIVVETGITTVVRTVERAGQFVTSGPHEIIVEIEVEKMVEVVNSVVDGETSEVETAGLLTVLDSIGVLFARVL